jgi:hypothetical protein
MKPPERIHALKGRDVAVVAGGETLRGRLADVQGDCLILHSDDFGVEVTVAVVRWPLVAAVIAKEEKEVPSDLAAREYSYAPPCFEPGCTEKAAPGPRPGILFRPYCKAHLPENRDRPLLRCAVCGEDSPSWADAEAHQRNHHP